MHMFKKYIPREKWQWKQPIQKIWVTVKALIRGKFMLYGLTAGSKKYRKPTTHNHTPKANRERKKNPKLV